MAAIISNRSGSAAKSQRGSDESPFAKWTLITVAPTGAEASKAEVPALPVTLEELVATARDCQAAGAADILARCHPVRAPRPRGTH